MISPADREPVADEALEVPEVPRRSAQVQRASQERFAERLELGARLGGGQPLGEHVAPEVEARVVLPSGSAKPERAPTHSLVEAWQRGQPDPDMLEEAVESGRRSRAYEQPSTEEVLTALRREE